MKMPEGLAGLYAGDFDCTYNKEMLALAIGAWLGGDFPGPCAHTFLMIPIARAKALRDLMVRVISGYEKEHGTIK